MTMIKLLTDGGYHGLSKAVGKNFQATKVLGHWNICKAELERVGCTPIMDDYAFFPREIEVEHKSWHSQGLLR